MIAVDWQARAEAAEARLARVEALADEWEVCGRSRGDGHYRDCRSQHLRAALAMREADV